MAKTLNGACRNGMGVLLSSVLHMQVMKRLTQWRRMAKGAFTLDTTRSILLTSD